MIHPLFRVVASRPELLADHAAAYAALAGAELDRTAAEWKRRLLFSALALGAIVVSVVLGGVALMLWAVTPVAAVHAPWALWAAPVVPAVLALGCWLAGRRQGVETFADMRRQLAADLAMLREVSNA